MSHGSHPARSSGANKTAPADAAAVAAFLRNLADRAEADPTFAAQLTQALGESGLLTPKAAPATRARRARKDNPHGPGDANVLAATAAAAPAAAEPPDPFALLREGGVTGLRAHLAPLDIADLRAIVRSCRFDPARISARWKDRERVIELIVSQTQARANHGKAFAQV